MSYLVREYHPADTDSVLELGNQSKTAGFDPGNGLVEVFASCQKDHAVVAEPSWVLYRP